MKRVKYFAVYSLPLSVYFSFNSEGIFVFLPLFIYFGLVPLTELFLKPDTSNFDIKTAKKEKKHPLYSLILYLAIPVQIIILIYFFNHIQYSEIYSLAFFGKITSMGLMCGVFGINIGHELGHRNNRLEQFMGELLLLSSLNTHFLPYHNMGHHANVATPNDAATARKNEILYLFWFRSHFKSYFEAWQLEHKRLQKMKKNPFSFLNRMITYTIANVLLLGTIYFFYNTQVFLAFLFSAVFGILLLETVNYIEHYGLLRKKDANGKYERIRHTHSWNSDHILGKLILFNLSRHSDHHYNASRKYQILKSVAESPQMPTGYPGMMLMALIPPIWFSFMNKKLQDLN